MTKTANEFEDGKAATVFLYAHDAGINPQQLQKLRRSGFIPVGVRYLSDVRVLELPASSIPISKARSDMILLAACKAIKRCGGYATDYFGEEMAKAIIADAEVAISEQAA